MSDLATIYMSLPALVSLGVLASFTHFGDDFPAGFRPWPPSPSRTAEDFQIENSPAASGTRPVEPAPLDLLSPSDYSVALHLSRD